MNEVDSKSRLKRVSVLKASKAEVFEDEDEPRRECDACGKTKPHVVERWTPHGEGSFCRACRGFSEEGDE